MTTSALPRPKSVRPYRWPVTGIVICLYLVVAAGLVWALAHPAASRATSVATPTPVPVPTAPSAVSQPSATPAASSLRPLAEPIPVPTPPASATPTLVAPTIPTNWVMGPQGWEALGGLLLLLGTLWLVLRRSSLPRRAINLVGFTLAIAISIAACQSPAAPMLRPGDEIGAMRLTTGSAKAVPLSVFCSPARESNGVTTVECRVPLVARLAIGDPFGVPDKTLANLDWSASAWELFVDNRAVDLSALGTYDVVRPNLTSGAFPAREVFRKIRGWDVVLANAEPGSHTLRGLVHAKTGTYRWTVNFAVVGRARASKGR